MTTDLIERLEKATEDDCKKYWLNADVIAASKGLTVAHFTVGRGDAGEDELQITFTDGSTCYLSENRFPLMSLDAAMTLVPEGVRVAISQSYGEPATWGVYLGVNAGHVMADNGDHGVSFARDWCHQRAPTPALALCIAALKAKDQS